MTWRVSKRFGPALAYEVGLGDAGSIGRPQRMSSTWNLAVRRVEKDILEHFLGQRHAYLTAVKRGAGCDAHQRPF